MKKLAYILIPLITLIIFIVPGHSVEASCLTGNVGDCLSDGLAFISITVLQLVGLVTTLAGTALNYVIWISVVHMADGIRDLDIINTAWAAIRDLANMAFIFVLLYASIQLILGIGKDVKRLIVNMIVAAVLINFSLFFTKVIIDVANLLAITFYHAIAPNAGADATSAGLSNAIMGPLGLTSILNSAAVGDITNIRVIIIGVMGSLVALVAAFVFFAMALMFLIRYAILILVLILSPLMFVAMILPELGKYTKQWWDALLNQAFFAPVYFILTWVVVQIINSPQFRVTTGLADAFLGTQGSAGQTYNASAAGSIVNFVVIIIFLIASLIIAKNISSKASPMVANLTKTALGLAGGASFGLAGRLGRATIGAAGGAIGDSERLKEQVAKGGIGGAAARLTLAAGRKTAGASFDVRGAGFAKSLDAGKAQKGGYTEDVKRRAKEEKEFGESLKPSDIEIDEAEQALRKAEGLDEASLQPERIEARTKHQARIYELEGVRADAVRRGASAEELKLIDNELASTQKAYDATEDNKKYKQSKIDEARERVDYLKGVSEDEAKKRIQKDKKLDKEGLKAYLDTEEGKKELKDRQQKSQAQIRKEGYAEALTDPRWVKTDLNPVLFVKKGDKQAAADLRKGKKKVEDMVKEALKASGEVKEEEGAEEKGAKKEEGGGETPAAETETKK